jgi:hypothetical protein
MDKVSFDLSVVDPSVEEWTFTTLNFSITQLSDKAMEKIKVVLNQDEETNRAALLYILLEMKDEALNVKPTVPVVIVAHPSEYDNFSKVLNVQGMEVVHVDTNAYLRSLIQELDISDPHLDSAISDLKKIPERYTPVVVWCSA